MPVTIARSTGTFTVTITVNIADIVAAGGLTNAEKRAQAINRAAAELAGAIAAAPLSDTEMDAQVAAAKAALDADAATRKAARPTGSF